MKLRIEAFIAGVTDPFATEVRYHCACWKKYVKITYNQAEKSDSSSHILCMEQAEKEMLQHVRKVILEDNEPRSLNGLLWDYNQLLEGKDLPSCEQAVQVKNLITKEFGSEIGFHVRYHRNKGTIVYDARSAGSYVEAAINSWGLSDEHLFKNVASRMRKQSQNAPNFAWPPHASELEKTTEPMPEIIQLLTWLNNPNQAINTEPDIRTQAVSDIVEALMTGKRTHFQVGLSSYKS